MRTLETRIPPPLVALLVAAFMGSVARWMPVASLSVPQSPHAAGLIALAGGLLAAAAALAFRRARTTVNPLRPDRSTVIVRSGVYRVTRNPMYLGLLLVLLGWWVYLGALSAIVGPFAFAAYIHRFQILPEERALAARFGAPYRAYMAEVRRWL